MTLSVLLPVHDKPEAVIKAVADAIDLQGADQTVVVLDRTPPGNIGLMFDGRHAVIRLDGPPGWRSPCISFNAGLAKVTGDITVITHSDIVHAPGNLARVREWMEARPAAYFAKVLESDPAACTGPGHAGPVLCASDNARALTFCLAVPTAALRAIGGWDEAFQDGVCFEDDDLTARLWKHGLDFVFDDAFHATHISHTRKYFTDFRIAPNMAHMLRKHGTLTLYAREAGKGRLIVDRQPGRTEWRHH